MSPVTWLVDRMHVGTSDALVEAEVRARSTRQPDAAIVDAWVAEALERHHENQAEYCRVMSGRLA